MSLLWSESQANSMCRRSGDSTPTGLTVCDNTTLRSSGARGLDVSRYYRHIAPLERKAKLSHSPSAVVLRFLR